MSIFNNPKYIQILSEKINEFILNDRKELLEIYRNYGSKKLIEKLQDDIKDKKIN